MSCQGVLLRRNDPSGVFLGWKPDEKKTGNGWRVLYVDGEMHIADIQERARLLLDAVTELNREMVGENLSFLSRPHEEPLALFPSITEPVGMTFMREREPLRPHLIEKIAV